MNTNSALYFLLFLSFLFSRCNTNEEITLPLSESISIFSLEDYYEDNSLLNNTIDSIYLLMTPEDRLSQLIISSMGEGTNNIDELIEQAKKGTIGGAVFLGGNRKLLSTTVQLQEYSKWPLLLSLDAEPSLINGRLSDLEQSFKKTSEAKNIENVINVSMEIAEILQSLGIHQNYAPVSDLAINKSIINKRSYGNNVEDVKSKTNAFIEEHQSSGIVATAKHFPGHGNAKGDSHNKLVSIHDLNEELEIFKSNIQSKVISIMVGHIAIDNGEFATNGKPSSISKNVITNLLRKKLGFNGIIITDAMNMKGVTQFKNADFKAMEAGVDLILMPQNPKNLIQQVKKAMIISAEFDKELQASVKRIIRLKLCLGLFTIDHIS